MAHTPEGLQRQLDGLLNFCSRFKMIVNQIKTKIMVFGTGSKKESKFYFNKELLDGVSEYKYLGVVITQAFHMGPF